MIYNLIAFLIVILILSIVWWIVAPMIPLDESSKRIARGIVAIIVILALCGILFGGIEFPVLNLRR